MSHSDDATTGRGRSQPRPESVKSAACHSLRQVTFTLTTPGDPAYEQLKAVLGQVNSLNAYEDYGYAVFMFIRWKWIYIPFHVPEPCSQVDFRTVPEGYSVPFVN
jgi:hypothetical protein